MVGPNNQIRSRLGCGIRAVGGQRRGLGKHPLLPQRAIYLISGHLEVAHSLFILPGMLVLRAQVPMPLRRVQQGLCTHNVGGEEHLRLHNAAVNMALRRKMNHSVKVIFPEQLRHQRLVPDIPLHKMIPGIVLHWLQILQIPGIGQQIQINQQDNILLVIQYILDEIGADKPRPAGH